MVKTAGCGFLFTHDEKDCYLQFTQLYASF